MFLILSLLSSTLVSANDNLINHTKVEAKYCSARGGCDCDCSWANSQSCASDDGSCCFGCCCGSSPGPSPSLNTYCPSANDITAAYGSPSIFDGGWAVYGSGGAATKASYNLLGGYVEYDIDFSNVRTGVNANIYTVSPTFWGEFSNGYYCDGAKTGSGFCLEVDWIETNGNCGAATTLHTVEGPGPNGCTAWGCTTSYYYNGRSSFHMRIEYDTDGTWRTYHDGILINPWNLSPAPGSYDWNLIQSMYSSRGAVIYSSQWTGWVPVADCGTYGDLYSSSFSVKNLVIHGSVVNGPTPRQC